MPVHPPQKKREYEIPPKVTTDDSQTPGATNIGSDEESKSHDSRTTTTSTGASERMMRHYKDPRRELHPCTAVIMAGYRSDLSESAIKPPVFRCSTFEFTSASAGERFFQRAYHLPGDDGEKPGLIYSRLNNPNTEILEDKMVALEQGSNHASAFPSGMSAISTTIMALVENGGHIIYSNPVYGGTYYFLRHMCPNRLGIVTQAVDTSDLSKLQAAVDAIPTLDALYVESPANPTLRLTDIAAASAMARAKNPDCVIMVDNTLMGPVFQQPFLHGADVVLYSATKFISGHSDLLAGIVLTKTETQMTQINAYRTILGPVIAPDTSWMLTRSLETVWMRMERQAQKALKVAAALANHGRVERVLFPGFYSCDAGAQRAVEQKLFQRQCTGTGSMISLVIRPNTRKAAYTVLDGVRLVHLAVSLGSTESLVEHPRSMTHSDMTEHDLDDCGISEGMLRVSVGLEASADIIADLLHALDQIEDE